MNKTRIIALALIVLSFIIAAVMYPMMPTKVASHWNAQGQVDGYMTKFWGVFLMPIISLGMFILFAFLPKIDPLKKNYAKFRKYYDGFILMIIGFFFYLYLITIFWNLEMKMSMNQMLVPAIAIVFYYSGVLMEHSKMNWFVGIRTPWTLSSKKVWEKTHSLGGLLFKVSAILSLFGLLTNEYSLWFMVAPIMFSSAYLILYSYLEYKKEKK